ncbi:MAG: hypothetical protein ACWA44_09360 [Thiotrichales bacterium]
MRTATLKIELLDDCIFSARAATTGGHQTLDRVPGSALLGAAATALYPKLDQSDSFALFHSGKMRFGDGLPWNGSTSGLPVPLSWHHPKKQSYQDAGRLNAAKIFNFTHNNQMTEGEQPKQMRKGYVHLDGAFSEPAHSSRLKTAIDASTGRSQEAQLFSYDALHKGQCFVTSVEADDEISSELFDEVIDSLKQTTLLGRSRSAEYGHVSISAIAYAQSLPSRSIAEDTIQLWLLSDLALNTPHGEATVQPDGETLGLPKASIDWSKSFLRHRRFSPWNAARHGYDRERLVLEAGGIITLKLNGIAQEEAINKLQNGLGLYREAGLGKVWINPDLLLSTHPEFLEERDVTQPSEPVKPDHPLIVWLENKTNTSWKAVAEAKARQLESEYFDVIDQSIKLNGIPDNVPYGPSKSQWGEISSRAKSRPANQLFDSLFNGESAAIKPKGEGWDIEVLDDQGQYRKLAEWLKTEMGPGQFQGENALRQYAQFVRILARRIPDRLTKRGV